MPSKSSTPIALRFPNEVLSELDALAELRNCSRPDAIRLAVDAGLFALRQNAAQEQVSAGRPRRRAGKTESSEHTASFEPGERPLGRRSMGKRKAAPTASTPSQDQPETKPDLLTFAAQAIEAGQRCKSGRFGEDRVLINHVWRQYKREHKPKGMDLEAFKRKLLEANRERYLSLVCADMAPLLDQKDVQESEIRHLSATFHFLCI
jgi:predicted transcriptional regulator